MCLESSRRVESLAAGAHSNVTVSSNNRRTEFMRVCVTETPTSECSIDVICCNLLLVVSSTTHSLRPTLSSSHCFTAWKTAAGVDNMHPVFNVSSDEPSRRLLKYSVYCMLYMVLEKHTGVVSSAAFAVCTYMCVAPSEHVKHKPAHFTWVIACQLPFTPLNIS